MRATRTPQRVPLLRVSLGPPCQTRTSFGPAAARRGRCGGSACTSRAAAHPPVEPAVAVALAYLSRGGNVPLTMVARLEPAIVRAALAHYAGCQEDDVPVDSADLRSWVLRQPYRGASFTAPNRVLSGTALDVAAGVAPDGWRCASPTGGDNRPAFAAIDVTFADWRGADSDRALAACRAAADAGSAGVLLRGSAERGALLDRLAFAERVRRETDLVTVVEGPPSLVDDLVDGLSAGRTDLILVTAQ